MRFTLFEISGPIPSPGISVTLCYTRSSRNRWVLINVLWLKSRMRVVRAFEEILHKTLTANESLDQISRGRPSVRCRGRGWRGAACRCILGWQ